MNWLWSVEWHLKIAGATLIFLALSHFFFDARFHWREETARMSRLNQQIFYVHNFFITLTVFLMGVLALFGTRALLEPTLLGRYVCGALAVFWAARLFCQFGVYDANLWRGRRFETAMHWLFALGWTYYTLVFGWAFWGHGA